MIRLTIGITIYNRRKTLERMIESLLASHLDDSGVTYTIRVYDDCSVEYTENDVRDMFPIQIEYYRHESNRGADYNMGYMYRDFLVKGDDILFNCDSDLIFDIEWLSRVMEYLPHTDGILSLFNTKQHSTVEKVGKLCVKETVGNAGTVMTRHAVELICDAIDEKESYTLLDHNWCKLYKKLGKKIYCTSRSYVQHIGFDGFNSSQGAMDIGENFVISGDTNGQILGDVLYDVVLHKKEVAEEKRSIYYLFPFDRIAAGAKLVIYGAGVVGNDYRSQVELCGYCGSVVQVDKNYRNLTGVHGPEELKTIDCDYILIAAHFASIREEMQADILSIDPKLENKLISDVCYSIRI